MSPLHGRQAVLLKYSSQNCGSTSIAYVDVDVDQLRALPATVEQGSLDVAARVLHVTPSAPRRPTPPRPPAACSPALAGLPGPAGAARGAPTAAAAPGPVRRDADPDG